MKDWNFISKKAVVRFHRQKQIRFMKKILPVTILLILPSLLLAQESDTRARQIFEEVDQRRNSVTYEESELQMVIYNSNGDTRKRKIKSYSYNDAETSKSLLIFSEPANVRGTGFLTVNDGENEVQKLYLPALGRIQIISASEKSDRFMGSDFTYEDLGAQDPDDYTFRMEAETDTAFVLDAIKQGNSQYDHVKFYIKPEKYALLKVEYFNGTNEMIKKLVADNLEKLNDQLWKPQTMTMYDLKNDRKTTLRWENRNTDQTIPQWRFTERGLRRGL